MSIAICLVLVLSTVDSSPFFPVADLPRAVHWAASAAYNNSIFIIGGADLRTQFIEYNILSDVMIDYGTHVMIDQGHPNEFGMYWSQYGNSLYVMDLVWNGHGEAFLDIYDLSSSLFPFNSSMITLQKGASNIIGVSACVVASEHFLFVAGGWEDGMLRILNVLSLPNHVWSLGPEMMIGRVNSGCAIMPDNYLYVLGGGTAENERVLINDLQNQQWQSIESFSTSSNIYILDHPGIAPYGDVIWVFGGKLGDPAPDLDKIWNIYTKDGSVSLLPESLPFVFSLETGTMIIVDNVVYIFGNHSSIKYVIPAYPAACPGCLEQSCSVSGYCGDDNCNMCDEPKYYPVGCGSGGSWCVLSPTSNPTENPSFNPSDEPSADPTDNPSFNPSDEPSADPTDNPSFNPSYIPTGNPSNQPSETPTDNPSFNPTEIPSGVPSNHPSETPSDNPSFNPTEIPSGVPSNHPSETPSDNPSFNPTEIPSGVPSNHPSETPSDNPSFNSTDASEDQDGTWMTYIVVVAIAITICLIIAVLLSCYFKEKTARQRTEHMISQEPRVEVTDHDDIECQDNDTECKDNDELYGERGDDEGSEHSNSEDLYDTQHVVATKGAMDCQMARRVNECTDCGQMEEVTEVNGLLYCVICREFIDDFDNEGDELYNAQSPKVTEGNTDGVECVDNDGHNQTMTAGSD
eukprot:567959_1